MPLHLLVKWEVVSPNSKEGQCESISYGIPVRTCELRPVTCEPGSCTVYLSCDLQAAPCVLRDDELRDATCELRPAP